LNKMTKDAPQRSTTVMAIIRPVRHIRFKSSSATLDKWYHLNFRRKNYKVH